MTRARTIALVGHNVITLVQAQRARRGLHKVLAALDAQRLAGEHWRFMTPLAPGSDYVLTCAALAWLAAQAPYAAFELHVCQHVELHDLVRAWIEQGGLERGTPDGEHGPEHFAGRSLAAIEAEIGAQLEALRERAQLTHASEALGLDAALARNDAHLLAHADELVVAIDSARFGTTPSAWLEAELSGLPPLGTAHLARAWLALDAEKGERLHVIDLRDDEVNG